MAHAATGKFKLLLYFHAIFIWLITNLLLFKGLAGAPPWFQPAMNALLAPIRADITQLRNELRTDIANVRSDLAQVRRTVAQVH
jgi:hypothetical protein